MAEQGSSHRGGRKGGRLYQPASSFPSVISSGTPPHRVYDDRPCLVNLCKQPTPLPISHPPPLPQIHQRCVYCPKPFSIMLIVKVSCPMVQKVYKTGSESHRKREAQPCLPLHLDSGRERRWDSEPDGCSTTPHLPQAPVLWVSGA